MLSAKEVYEVRIALIDKLLAKATKCQDKGQWKAASKHLEAAAKIIART